MNKLLLAEDEDMLAQAIIYALEQEGMLVTRAANGEEAIGLLQSESFDMALLDITMPRIDGLEVARRIRARQDIPILLLTALSGEQNILTGFEVGADDYLTKPFSYRELIARVKAILHRCQVRLQKTGLDPVLTHGRLTIDPNSYMARMGDETLPLTLTEFRILVYMISNAGRACGGKEILKAAQGYDVEEYEAREILRVHIQHLRQKMKTKKGNLEHIENVYGVGYIIRAAFGPAANSAKLTSQNSRKRNKDE